MEELPNGKKPMDFIKLGGYPGTKSVVKEEITIPQIKPSATSFYS